MILLTTGHFAGGNGSIAFCKRNPDNLVKRTNAAITVEHLGLREWDEISLGQMGPTGVYEPGAIFSPGSQTLVDTSYRTIVRSKAPPAAVLKPLAPDARGSPDQPAWPGEGQYLYAVGKIADANFITGPTYLLNWGIETISRCNHKRVRAQAMTFTEGVLALGRKSRKSLRSYTL